MSDTRDVGVESTPWHLWVIGIVALVWSALGAMDYVMTQTRNEAYMSGFTPEQLSFFLRHSDVGNCDLGYCGLGWSTWRAVAANQAASRGMGVSCLANCDGNYDVSKLRPVQWNGDYGRRLFPRIYCRDISVRAGIFSLRPRNA